MEEETESEQDCPKDNIHQETGGVSVGIALHS